MLSIQRHVFKPLSFLRQMMPLRAFAQINFNAIKAQNSVLKVYNQLVEEGQIRSDPKQLAVVNILDRWQ